MDIYLFSWLFLTKEDITNIPAFQVWAFLGTGNFS